MTRRPLLAALAVAGALPALAALLEWAGVPVGHVVRFARPELCLPGALVVALVAWTLARLPDRPILRRVATELTLALATLCALLAVLGVEIGHSLDRLSVIIAIDRSRSIELVPHAAERISAELVAAETSMREDDRIATLAFGADAAIEDPLRPRTRVTAAQTADVGKDGTDLASALRRALAEVPPDSAARIVLCTDGVATRGDTLSAAAAAAAAGVPVDAVPLDQGRIRDVRLQGVRLASRADEGQALDVAVVTSATQATEVELRLFRDGELIRRGTVQLPEGEDVVHLREIAPAPGLHRYDVELGARDPHLDEAREDNSASAFVRVRGQATALVMNADPKLAEPMVRALESSAFRVDSVGPSATPADIAGFAAYDVVVLSQIAASTFAPSQLDALGSYVRDFGGGLLLMGGERSMGPGGFARTPVEQVSPISFDLKQNRKRASLAEIIAVDYSGSMSAEAGGRTKLELANEAAVRSADLLGAGDRLGVMHVDTEVRWTVPLAPVEDQQSIASRIRAVSTGGGGIYVDLALASSYAALAREHVNLKHVLLFADGDDAEQMNDSVRLVSNAKRQGITTSVIALGRGSDVAALERLSKLGDGRFYLIEDATRLPAVFAQETILAARSSINEVTFVPTVATAGAAIRGIDFARAPPLTGYVVGVPKSRAQVHLTGPDGDPLLATWSAGIGRAAAFTSDYEDRWGKAWTGWSGGARLFAQIARDIARLADDPRVRVQADATGGELHLSANVVDDDGRTESFRRFKVRLAGPGGFARELPLEVSGAGVYSTSVPLSRLGPYVATVIDEAKGEPVGTTGAVLSAGEELRPTGSDRAILARIALMTGGKVRDTLAGLFDDRSGRRFAYDDVSGLSAMLSALFLLTSVATRRLLFSWRGATLFARLTNALSRLVRRRATDASASASAVPTLGALLRRKARAPAHAPSVPVRGHVPRSRSTPHAPAASAAPTAPDETPPPSRPRTAAEILLERRRQRGGG